MEMRYRVAFALVAVSAVALLMSGKALWAGGVAAIGVVLIGAQWLVFGEDTLENDPAGWMPGGRAPGGQGIGDGSGGGLGGGFDGGGGGDGGG